MRKRQRLCGRRGSEEAQDWFARYLADAIATGFESAEGSIDFRNCLIVLISNATCTCNFFPQAGGFRSISKGAVLFHRYLSIEDLKLGRKLVPLVCQKARQLLQLGLGQFRIGVGADTHSNTFIPRWCSELDLLMQMSLRPIVTANGLSEC